MDISIKNIAVVAYSLVYRLALACKTFLLLRIFEIDIFIEAVPMKLYVSSFIIFGIASEKIAALKA